MEANAEASERAQAPDARWPAAWPALLFAAVFALGLVVYRQALPGAFVSDDFGYFASNPYTRSLDLANVWAIVNPFGPAKLYTANYAPVHLLLTALERQMFADAMVGYHIVNVAVHALNTVLLVALLRRSAVPPLAALIGGGLFALHPANVEAVAWISQLKTNAALALSFGALLLYDRRPALAPLVFALALLTKASAAFALPMAAVLAWCRRGQGDPRAARFLVAWVGVLILYAVPQGDAFRHLGQVEVAAYEDVGVHARTIAAVGMRYLVMAATGWGVAAFQEPPPAESPWDPWWLASLPAGALLLWRTLATLRAGDEEAAWWVAAAASFGPVSQLFPFHIPVADRYLYFILPGLIGGALLAARSLPGAATLGRVAVPASLALIVLFGFQSQARARLWTSETLLLLDAARHYPDGATAHFLRARSAAGAGDADLAIAELRMAVERGIDRYQVFSTDPGLASIRDHPELRALTREMAGRFIEVSVRRGVATQPELRAWALAHVHREEYAEAVAVFERALAAGGLQDETVRAELAAARARLAAVQGEGGRDGP